MSLLSLNAEKVSADTSPVAPAALPSQVPDQSPNPVEYFRTLSDVGELGYLFDHNPAEWAPAPLEGGSSPASLIEANAQDVAEVGPTLVDTSSPQPSPTYVTEEAFSSAGGWKFKDTIRKEVGSFQGWVNQMVNRPGVDKGYNDGQH